MRCTIICFLLTTILLSMAPTMTSQAVPGIYIFGDSLMDVGTNNLLLFSRARANFPYNGIDYPSSIATGRFSNGFNTADQIAKLMGYEASPPPYLVAKNSSCTNCNGTKIWGVNFASGGSGIINTTGSQLYTEVGTLDNQIKQFQDLVGRNLTDLDALPKSLFIVAIGSNDIFDHYRYNRTTISKPDFIDNVQATYYGQLKSLTELGARRFGIISPPPVGCCPYARALNGSSGGCLDELNDYAQALFNVTKTVLQKLSLEVEGMKYSLGNAYDMTMDFMENPLVFGFTETESACCGNGTFNGEGPCYYKNNPNLCDNRADHLFWDMYHPTEAASRLAALTLYGAGLKYVTPMNFSQLVAPN